MGFWAPTVDGIFPHTMFSPTAEYLTVGHMCVSDENKRMLLAHPDFLPMLVSGLLLAPDHPRQSAPEAQRVWCQTMHAECLMQLAVFPPGREALLESPAVLGALEALAEQALSDEARDFGRGALIALTGEQGGSPRAPDGSDGAHVMLSCKSEALGLVCVAAVSLTSKGIGVRSMGLSARDYPAQREPAAEGLQHLVRSVRALSAIRPIVLPTIVVWRLMRACLHAGNR